MSLNLTADLRRHAQTVFFPPDDLPGGKPACPSGNQVLKCCHNLAMKNINSTINFSRHINKNNRMAIDGFLSRGSRDKRVCVRLRGSRG
jgi:hypothetical protein